MTYDPLGNRRDRTALRDEDGRVLLVYSLSADSRDDRPLADGVWRPKEVSVAEAVSESLDRLSGHAVSTSDSELADAWAGAGAERLRHAQVMSHALAGIDALRSGAPEGLRTHRLTRRQLLRHADRLGSLMMTAYPPGHPDHRFTTVEHAARSLQLVADDQVLGPFLDVSQVAVLDHTVIGAALAVDRPGTAPDGGPWVLDIFRDPDVAAKGVGRALLIAVLAAAKASGLPSISLVVSHGNNRALDLYAGLGFAEASTDWTLALPATDGGHHAE